MLKRIDKFIGEHRFLSNFYFCDVQYLDLTWPTVEHVYQAMKTMDIEARENIRTTSSPRYAKRAGRGVILRYDWEQVKRTLMFTLVWLKFTQNKDLVKKLLATGDAELIEGNYWHDNIWGACTCGKCSKGENRLGKILMKVRDELREVQGE